MSMDCVPSAIDARTRGAASVPAQATGEKFEYFDFAKGFACKNSKQKDGRCQDYEVRFCCHQAPKCSGGKWTNWLNRDLPWGSGDWELISDLKKEGKMSKECFPLEIDARTRGAASVPAQATGEKFEYFDATKGFACKNSKQGDKKCQDYEVRFCCYQPPTCDGSWTNWMNRDNPDATGDWETIKVLQQEGKLSNACKPSAIEARTRKDKVPALATGEKFKHNDTAVGFACINEEQADKKCQDYEVRFCCPRSCNSWTNWISRDRPTNNGDWELLKNIRSEKRIPSSCKPSAIEARTIKGQTPASKTKQRFKYYDATTGFACVNKDNSEQCHDYQVRFCC